MQLRNSLLLLLTLTATACIPRAVSPGPRGAEGSFVDCTVSGEGGICRVSPGSAAGKVSITLEGAKIETGAQQVGVSCVGVIGGVRCDLGTLALNTVYRLPYKGALKTASVRLERANKTLISLSWP